MDRQATISGGYSAETFDGRTYKLYVPTTYQPGVPAPLVVMLHGCTQNPDQIATSTQLNALAEAEGFLAVYPEQSALAHARRCWRWYDPEHMTREIGEPALIAGMTRAVMERFAIDPGAVFVGGLSAGGAMASIVGATYPDLFAAIGVSCGLEFAAGTNMLTAKFAMYRGGPDPIRQGAKAFAAMGTHKRLVPVIAFHGTCDNTVAEINCHQVIAQWICTNRLATGRGDIPQVPTRAVHGRVDDGRHFTRFIYEDAAGVALFEKVIVDEMGHAWSGGHADGTHVDPLGPDATALMWDFFKQHRRPSGDQPA